MAGEPDNTKIVLDAAVRLAAESKAKGLLAYVDRLVDLDSLAKSIKKPTDLILIATDDNDVQRAERVTKKVLAVPNFKLTRMGQVKMATLLAFSQRMLNQGDTFVFLTGVVGQPNDTVMLMSVGKEYELFQTVDQPKLMEHIKRVVFQRILTLALELANEGREGKSVGALFVVGDNREVQKCCQQNIINPFKGYDEKDRNILDEQMKETVKEFSSIDGAFILKGNGVIVSAGTTLRPTLAGEELPKGLGTRHAVAAAITANTKSIAITVSESTGTVRLWRRGQMITEIERAVIHLPPTPPPPATP